MKITRRHLLAFSAATAAATAICGGTIGLRWWDQPPGGGRRQLADAEAAFVQAFAGAAFPSGDFIDLSGADADLDVFFDAVLDGMPAMTADLMRLLIQALERASILTHGQAFTALSLSERQAMIRRWTRHDLAEVRGSVTSLVVLLGMGYTTHPEVALLMNPWHRCGYGR